MSDEKAQAQAPESQKQAGDALEEQLATDVETLHFAVAKRDESGGVLTAVVAHERMLEWQAMFERDDAGATVKH